MAHQRMSRREFSVKSAMAILNGVVITVSGCGDSSSSATAPAMPSTPAPAPAPAANDITGAVSANHGHVATVTAVQLASTNDITIDIDGAANHPHQVTITAAELEQIRNGASVAVASSVLESTGQYANIARHGHTVTFN